MASYYNEIDAKAAAWLRELIKAGEIADGEVDTRSIADVTADDVRGFTQCHFFAGIGGWSLGLRLAGWPDDRPVWTGSCPCQPFSAAGAQGGTNDPRHLWPTWFRLIEQCRPCVVFGEQVESAIAHGWWDLVADDLERADYACGAVGLPAAAVGAFHQRQRLWFVADDEGRRFGIDRRRTSGLDDAEREGLQGFGGHEPDGGEPGWFGAGSDGSVAAPSVRLLADAEDADGRCEQPARGARSGRCGSSGSRAPHWCGFWDDAIWIDCTDGKARPIKPGIEPLAYGIPARVGRLRGYGNAIVPQEAAAVIDSYLAVLEGRD